MERNAEASVRICHIVGGGDFSPVTLKRHLQRSYPAGDFLIAADRGAAYLLDAGVTPDLVIGDYDSLGASPRALDYGGKTPEIFTLPKEKDDTDLAAAAFLAIDRGFRRLFLYGALGGTRFSHSMSAVQLLSALRDRGCRAAVLDRNCTLLFLQNESLFIPKDGFSALADTHADAFLSRLCYRPEKGRFFSLFVLTDSACVTERGLKYPLENAHLTNRYPLGVSNEFTGTDALAEVREGCALAVLE